MTIVIITLTIIVVTSWPLAVEPWPSLRLGSTQED
jgi:hypothetical protein